MALSPTVPTFLAQSARAAGPDRDGRVLVVIQLEGGNDAINTLVPFADEGYARNRKVLRMPEKNLIRVNDHVGLHPALRGMGKLLERGQLALVPGVGYPNPNRSHFESMAIWQTARLDPEEPAGPGWIGRGLDERVGDGREPQPDRRCRPLHRRRHATPALRGRRAAATSLERIEDLTFRAGSARSLVQTRLDDGRSRTMTWAPTYGGASSTPTRPPSAWPSCTRGRPADADVSYPDTALAGRLQTVAQLLKADLGAGSSTPSSRATTPMPASRTRITGCSSSFPERSRRSWTTWPPRNWPSASRCWASASSAAGWPRTARRAPTTARPAWCSSPGRAFARRAWKVPSLTDLVDGDPKISTDFRRVYAAVLEDWLGLPSRLIAGNEIRADAALPAGTGVSVVRWAARRRYAQGKRLSHL